MLADLDEPERHSFAIFCLCQIGSAAVEPLIETLREDADPDARYASARALGMIGDPRTIPSLIAALSDPEPAVRYCAVAALTALKATSARTEIQKLVKDKYLWVCERAHKALEELGASDPNP